MVTICTCTDYSIEGVFSPHVHGLRGLRNQFGLSIDQSAKFASSRLLVRHLNLLTSYVTISVPNKKSNLVLCAVNWLCFFRIHTYGS